MNKQQFLEYTQENFEVSGEFMRVLDNILSYAECLPQDDQYEFLCYMLDGTIGYTDNEIKEIEL